MSGTVAVIGADAAGLVAAIYLARAGAKVVVLEAGGSPGGADAALATVGNRLLPASPATLRAFDPQVIRDLGLRDLRFAARDLALVALRPEGRPLVLVRDRHDAALGVGLVSPGDVERFGAFRHDLDAFARAMRVSWWKDGTCRDDAVLSDLQRLAVTSASAAIDAAFASDAVKAAFAFDVLDGSMSPLAAGSSLVLAWQAAQEMCGLQAAVAVPRGGRPVLIACLVEAADAADVEIRVGAPVERLQTDGDSVSGVVLHAGDVVPARAVLSSLSRRRTLLGMLPTGAIGLAASHRLVPSRETGDALLLFTLDSVPGFASAHPPARFVIADRSDAGAAAHAEARTGRLPSDLVLEAVVPPSFDPDARRDGIFLVVTARPVPVSPLEGWQVLMPSLIARVLDVLEHHAPGLRASVTGIGAVPPKPGDEPLSAAHIVAGWRERLTTPLAGLFLCGDAAEPVPSLSCRAARHAAALALAHLKRSVS